MDRELGVTEAECLEAIRMALGIEDRRIVEGPDIFTTSELVEKLDMSRSSVKRYMKQAMEAGRLEQVWTLRDTLDGRLQRVPGYRVMT